MPHGKLQPSIYRRDNIAGHKQSGRFLRYTGDSFLTQVNEDPMREDILLNLRLTTKEELTDNEKVGRTLSCREHGIVVFRILRRKMQK